MRNERQRPARSPRPHRRRPRHPRRRRHRQLHGRAAATSPPMARSRPRTARGASSVKVVRVTPKGVDRAHRRHHRPQRRGGAQGHCALCAARAAARRRPRASSTTPTSSGCAPRTTRARASAPSSPSQNYGAGDLLEVRLEGQRNTELIPFTDAFVPVVDVAGGTRRRRAAADAATMTGRDEERRRR